MIGIDLNKKLIQYKQSLFKDRSLLNKIEISYLEIANASILNLIGKLQRESYLKYNVFSKTELDLIRSAYRLNYFTHSNSEDYMILLLNQLKKAFQMGRLSEVMIVIQYMKYNKIRSTSTDYQLLDILEYITKVTITQSQQNNFTHWINLFDILFRGSIIKICLEQDHVSFYCQIQNALGEEEKIILSICNYTECDNDRKQAILQTQSISIHQSILAHLLKQYKMTDNFFPIGIHIDRLNGYLFSLRYHSGVYIASKISDEYIFIPQNEQEYKHFLFNTHLIQILFHLKKHYIELAKFIRRTASNRNMWFVHDIHF